MITEPQDFRKERMLEWEKVGVNNQATSQEFLKLHLAKEITSSDMVLNVYGGNI